MDTIFRYTPSYRICNYCDHFKPNDNSYMWGYCYDYDERHPTHPFSMHQYYSRGGSNGCPKSFKKTIHNHFGIDSPQYAEEYSLAVAWRSCLKCDIKVYTKNFTNTLKH